MDVIEETEGLKKISVGELRRLCRQARDKQRAVVLEESVRRFPDSMLVTVPAADLRVLTQGGRVEVQETEEGIKKRVSMAQAQALPESKKDADK